ncbi:hypothetical protein [Nocardiopsis potens]|uniref:hypothetical protein n=1 Tax=Nocardiopsis potens TaxID=1246458 RepID=UPI0003615B3F|nr:hypothetical protein [Nocardiopsis potens]
MAHLPRRIYAIACDARGCHAILRDTLGDELLVWGLDLSREEAEWADSLNWLITPSRRAYCPLHAPEVVDTAVQQAALDLMGAAPIPGLDPPG